MIDGMARSKLKRPDSRLPITLDLLKNIIKILQAFCNSRYEAVLFSNAFPIGFFAFLRVGACGREGSIEAYHAIKIENVEVTIHYIKIYLASSKTDQLGRGTSICVARQSDVRWNLSGQEVSVWIVGSSLIRNAFVHARSRTGGVNLGLHRIGVKIWWQGYGGMGLKDLESTIKRLMKYEKTPKYLVLHIAGNDLGKTK
ncbi:unnamed protein product [Mytilus edulis]|uniref:Uncharacterized protein n=1 Tax=Mytilus edulis TaxID=6550 RepID=A0A8S3S8D6_MYTED|nr:unnamed protein product [Mytilus edulis]